MNTVEKIIIYKKDTKIKSCYVLFSNGKTKKINKKQYRLYIEQLQSKYAKTSKELIEEKKIYICHNKEKYQKLVKEFDCLFYKKEYRKSKKISKVLQNILLVLGTCNTLIANFIYTGFDAFEILLNNLTFLFSLDVVTFLYIEKKLKKELNIKKKEFKTVALLSLFLGVSSYVSNELPNIKTIPYCFEINHTDIENTNNYEGLNDEQFHEKATETIFNNVHNNPYLDKTELEILYELKDYVKNNPYLDLNDVFHKLMTIRVEERYSLGHERTADYRSQYNLVRYYYNLETTKKSYKREVLIHEYIHSIGNLSSRALNEGMTSILTQDIISFTKIDYFNERTCCEYIIDLVGENVLLEAFSKKDQNILTNELKKIFDQEESILELYELLEEFCNGNITEDDLVLYINEHLIYGHIEKSDWIKVLNFHYDFTKEESLKLTK